MGLPMPLLTGATQRGRSATPLPGITNLYDPVRTLPENQGYEDATGNLISIGAFVPSGLFPVVSGQTYVFSTGAGPDNWVINQGVHFWSDLTTHSSFDNATPVLSGDLQTITFTAPISGYGSLNYKYGIQNIYDPANVIPAGSVAAFLPYVMLAKGSLAVCLTAYGEAGTIPTAIVVPDLSDSFLILKHGQKLFYRFRLSDTQHIVHRFTRADPTYFYNADFQLTSWVVIPANTKSHETVGAFYARYTPVPSVSFPDMFYIENDNSPAYFLNHIFLGGNHGIFSWKVTKTAHGKTNVDRGSLWSQGGQTYMLTRIWDANSLVVTPIPSGPSDLWVISTATMVAGTLTHVSGATHTGSIVHSPAPSQTQLWPSLQGVKQTILKDNGLRITLDGVYSAQVGRIHIDYRIPNAPATLDYIAANLGSSADIFYNHSSITAQTAIHLEYNIDKHAVHSVRHQAKALQAQIQAYMWPSQNQALTHIPDAGQTLHFFAEGVIPFQSGQTQSGGGSRDFSAFSDVSINALEYYFDQVTWAPGAFWADGVQHAPTLFMFEVRDAGGVAIKRYGIANDDDEARTSVLGYSTRVGVLSGFEKFYPVSAYERTIAAGDITSSFGAFGPIDPGFDIEGINFAYWKGGGVYALRWHRDPRRQALNGNLTNYHIPVHAHLIGKRVRIVKRSVTLTVLDTVVGVGGIPISTTGSDACLSGIIY